MSKHPNIVDDLCHLLGIRGSGRLTKLAAALGVSRQVVNGWKTRNKLPETQYARASDLTGKPVDYFLGWKNRGLTVTMSEFVADLPRFVQEARSGNTVTVTVNGNPVVRMSSPH